MGTRLVGRKALVAAGLAGAAVALGLLHVGWGADPVTERASVSSAGGEGNFLSVEAAVSADGRFVAFASDALNLVPNDIGARDVFVRDRQPNVGAVEVH